MKLHPGRWIQWWARTTPTRPAIVFEGQTITYRDLATLVNQLGHGLAQAGVHPGDRVAVLLANHPLYIASFFAASAIGARFVPLNTRLVRREMEFIIRDSTPKVVISEARFG